jgi:hypothetical protein
MKTGSHLFFFSFTHTCTHAYRASVLVINRSSRPSRRTSTVSVQKAMMTQKDKSSQYK